MDLSEGLVFGYLQSEEEFPIDLDDVWEWAGWRKKQDAKNLLLAHFEEGIDFLRLGVKSPSGGRPSEWIVLSCDCFKSLAMMPGTERGKQVRKYFIACEKKLKEILLEQQKQRKKQVVKLLVSDQHTAWQKRFEDEWFEEAYRTTGWKKTKTGHPQCMGKFIKENVYEHFPEGVIERLESLNPREEKGRKRKHHQHLKNLGIDVLNTQNHMVLAVMRLSPTNNRKKLERNIQKALGRRVQLEMPFLDGFD